MRQHGILRSVVAHDVSYQTVVQLHVHVSAPACPLQPPCAPRACAGAPQPAPRPCLRRRSGRARHGRPGRGVRPRQAGSPGCQRRARGAAGSRQPPGAPGRSRHPRPGPRRTPACRSRSPPPGDCGSWEATGESLLAQPLVVKQRASGGFAACRMAVQVTALPSMRMHRHINWLFQD